MERRKFLRNSLAATTALGLPWILPSGVLAGPGRIMSNDRINLAFIGLGNKAFIGVLGSLLQSFIAERSCRVVALCDVYQPNLDRALEYVNAYYGNEDCAAYSDFREIMIRDDVDAVVIATPDHWHAPMTTMAFENGKDVYCEKAVINTIEEARRVTEAANRYSRVIQCGSQSRSNPKFEYACGLIKAGRIGDLQKVDVNCYMNPAKEQNWPPEPVPEDLDWNMWLGPAPWRPYHPHTFEKWRDYPDFAGGGISDRGAHQFDIVQWGLGMDFSGPERIIPPGKEGKQWFTFVYAGGLEATMYDLNVYTKINQGVYFHGSEGMIYLNPISAETRFQPEFLDKEFITDKTKNLHWRKNIHGTNHYTNFLDCIRSRQMPNAQVEIGVRSTALCVVSNLALKLDRPLEWDAVNMKITGDPLAESLERRIIREPWHV